MAPFLPFVHTPEQLEGKRAEPGEVGSEYVVCSATICLHAVGGSQRLDRHAAGVVGPSCHSSMTAAFQRECSSSQPPKIPPVQALSLSA